MEKLGRNYSLRVQGSDGEFITIRLPFTLELDITRNILTGANVSQFRIYNLNERNRNLLKFNLSNYTKYQSVELKAGYGDTLSTIFFGNISNGWSVRQGVDYITTIECYDGGFAYNNARAENISFSDANGIFTQREIISSLVGSLEKYHVKPGKIGAIANGDEASARGTSYSGNTIVLLQDLTGGAFFIDNGIANILTDNEYLDLNLPVFKITAQTGLIDTPVQENTLARLNMIFEPALNVGHRIQVESQTNPWFNGYYKVTSVKHRGTISDAVAGELITSVDFLFSKTLVGV